MKEKVCGIYKITNKINGMSYCGQSVNCMNRWNKHKSPSSNVAPIDKAIKEFGVENFNFQILLECPPDMLDVWERDMINLHDTLYPKGYNMSGGGRSGFDTHEETRRKISESNKGKHNYSEEMRRKVSIAMKGNKNCLGREMKTSTRQKISESLKDHHPSESTRRKMRESRKKYLNLKWLTPEGEIKIMDKLNAKYHHPDWVLIEKDL